jgi:hypothetical protein
VDEIEGALHALLELHYSVDILAEHQLEPRLAEYPVVVVPDAHKLTDGFRAALLEYARSGGSLVLLGAKSARLFADDLGVTFDPNPHGGPVELVSGDGFVNVMGPWERVSPTSAEAAGIWHPTRDTRKDGTCAATVTAIGQGRIAAVYGPVALTYFRSHHPYLRDFIGGLMGRAFPDPDVRIDGPPCIDVALRHTADGRLSVHLLNTAGLPLGSRTAVDYIPPLSDVGVHVSTDRPPRRVTLEPGGAGLPFTYADGVASVIVPRLEIHEVVVVE